MLETFKKDFWTLSRERKGYYAWAGKSGWKLCKTMRRLYCPICCDYVDGHELVDSLLDSGLGLHPLFDIVFDALARAESRLSLRFIPQKSNEERLTGHLISEIEAAIHLALPSFEFASRERYGKSLDFDFSYIDLSRGGHDEKLSGGDLGIVLSIDLPDRPSQLRYVAIQAKKLSKTSSLIKTQFNMLETNYKEGAAYLFYDMEFDTLAPPMLMMASQLKDKLQKDRDKKSFSITQDEVFKDGVPLSLWLLTQLAMGEVGKPVKTLKEAIDAMRKPFDNTGSDDDFHASRVALISVGRSFQLDFTNNESLEVSFRP